MGISEQSALRSVVLPACVPPLTKIFNPRFTALESSVAISWDRAPMRARSSRVLCCIKCLRIFTAQCSAVISGITTCKRLPSGSRASTNGCERSKRRPLQMRARSTSCFTDSEVRTRLMRWLLPARAMNIRSGALIQISSTVGSAMRSAIGPKTTPGSMVSMAQKVEGH